MLVKGQHFWGLLVGDDAMLIQQNNQNTDLLVVPMRSSPTLKILKCQEFRGRGSSSPTLRAGYTILSVYFESPRFSLLVVFGSTQAADRLKASPK